MYRLDKTQVTRQTAEQADNTRAYWLTRPLHERWQAGWYLTCQAFGIDYKNPPRMEKILTNKRKHER